MRRDLRFEQFACHTGDDDGWTVFVTDVVLDYKNRAGTGLLASNICIT